MTSSVELPGLERLIDLCHRQKLGLKTLPPRQTPPRVGTLVEGLPFDPILAAVYARLGYAAFAIEAHADLALKRHDDTASQIEETNHWWSKRLREQLPLPTFVFAVEPMTAYYYATVPVLSDAEGRQPVVLVDTYEDIYALPVASSVDCFFDAYSRYLEALLALPDGREKGASLLSFPWGVPDIIGRDGRLVELIHQGRFDSLMVNAEAQGWARKVVNAGLTRR